jgi:hypothetical protein
LPLKSLLSGKSVEISEEKPLINEAQSRATHKSQREVSSNHTHGGQKDRPACRGRQYVSNGEKLCSARYHEASKVAVTAYSEALRKPLWGSSITKFILDRESKLAERQVNVAEMDHRGGGFWFAFVVFAIALGPAIPRIRALPDELSLSARYRTFSEWPIITKKSYHP